MNKSILKKICTALCLFIVLCVTAKAQYESIRSPLSDEEKERISRYNLKSMKLYFVADNHDSLVQSMQYDRNGKLVRTLSEGIIYNYKYDKDENTIEMTDSMLKNNDGKELSDTFKFQYDANGYLKYARFNGDESFFIYDPKSYTLVETRHDHAWPEPVISAYTYDPNKEITEMHYTNPSDQSKITEKITYNDHAKVLKDFITRTYGDGNVDTVITTYSYNERGKQSLEETYSSSLIGKDHSFTRSRTIRKDFYDSQDRMIEEFLFENGKEKDRYIFTYDDYGYEPISETYYSNGIQQRVDKFTLDEHGLPATLTETEGDVTTRYRYEFSRW